MLEITVLFRSHVAFVGEKQASQSSQQRQLKHLSAHFAVWAKSGHSRRGWESSWRLLMNSLVLYHQPMGPLTAHVTKGIGGAPKSLVRIPALAAGT